MCVLNFTVNNVFSVAVRGSSFVPMTMPWLRADGGRTERNSRADRAPAENGLNLVFTSVMNRVIILGGRLMYSGRRGGDGGSFRGARTAFVLSQMVGQWPGN